MSMRPIRSWKSEVPAVVAAASIADSRIAGVANCG